MDKYKIILCWARAKMQSVVSAKAKITSWEKGQWAYAHVGISVFVMKEVPWGTDI